ncbi:MAG TPA: gamma-glutamylcyclotransferase family protein [Candidatus Binatia bacterium]|nr:gamma-glutamylcyclotransferase family protein [Candidatus Binatia bacterium]
MSTVWYFAYGSNMQTATFRGRRGIAFRRALPARAAGWRLVFDKPSLLAVGEAYANIVADAAAEVLGVLYEIGADDLGHLEATEGVPLGNYARREIAVEPLAAAAGVPPSAVTFVSVQRDPSLRPSTRYVELVVAGAREHGLPAAWIAFLESVPARPETPAAARLRLLLDDLMKRRR